MLSAGLYNWTEEVVEEVEARGYELAFLQHYLHYGSDSGKTAKAARPTAYRV